MHVFRFRGCVDVQLTVRLALSRPFGVTSSYRNRHPRGSKEKETDRPGPESTFPYVQEMK